MTSQSDGVQLVIFTVTLCLQSPWHSGWPRVSITVCGRQLQGQPPRFLFLTRKVPCNLYITPQLWIGLSNVIIIFPWRDKKGRDLQLWLVPEWIDLSSSYRMWSWVSLMWRKTLKERLAPPLLEGFAEASHHRLQLGGNDYSQKSCVLG